MYYKIKFNVSKYQPMPEKDNYEAVWMNDYMKALKDWSSTESSKQEVTWRLLMFSGMTPPIYDEKYVAWAGKSNNVVSYPDRLKKGHTIQQRPSGFIFKQPQLYAPLVPLNVEKYLAELGSKGKVKVPFADLYMPQNYYKGLDGCYMSIEKIDGK